MKFIAALSVPAMLLGVSVLTVSPAEAHTPHISADCNGVRVAATAYDPSKANKWSVTIDGVTQSGTFGASLDQTFPVPQGGATTAWSAVVEAEDGTYHGEEAGTVGPCGTPPQPPAVDRSEEQVLEGCDVVFEGTTYGAGVLTYDEQFTDTYVFNAQTNAWDLVTDTTPTVANLDFTPWSTQEQVAAGCTDAPQQPPAEESAMSTTALDCETEVQVTTTTTTTTAYVYDAQTNTWVLGEPVSSTTTSESPVQAGDCDDTEVLGAQAAANPLPQPAVAPAPKAAPAPSVPTAVDAGLAPAAAVASDAPVNGPAGPDAGVLALLVGGGLLIGAGALRTRRA